MMKTWQELLLNKVYVQEEAEPLGRNGHQVCAALDALHATKWFANVGTRLGSERAVAARSWEAVLGCISHSWDAGYGGNHPGPSDMCSVKPGDPDYQLADRAFELAGDALHFAQHLPFDPLGREDERVSAYIHSWAELLFCEILRSHRIDCTYFREQLQWFHAGHFPCGWEGEWPVGKIRVF